MNAKHVLKLLAPYLAVGVFWLLWPNAWFAILAYHAQILFWMKDSRPEIKTGEFRKTFFIALPTVLAGPALYLLLPHITNADLSGWLEAHHLSRLSFALMIPYFGVVHPFLEQLHWSRLRDASPVSHIMFAGYHAIVLYSLLDISWLALSFVVLVATSFSWRWMERKSGGLAVPIASHILADLGVVVAAWLSM